ncbi:MAG: SUMF1/EgtB/PvdO family nonheme iron enzyme, partial [Caldilineaceae bacterium]|nr:SUMF1/EgtB/PvdO family nonheme iron enzyme [Caldilineaceae bacterium]
MSTDIFLSYSHQDSDIMAKLRADLSRAGFSVWTDEGLEPGTASWQRAIRRALREARCMVVILSPDAEQSKWVEIELGWAERFGLRIFPVLAKGEFDDAVPFSLVHVQQVDIRTAYENVEIALLPTLQRHLGVAEPVGDAEVREEMTHPMAFDWVPISAGAFRMGSDKTQDKDAYDDETPQHSVAVADFKIARVPVTVAQFAAFVDATGHRTTAEKEGSAQGWSGKEWEVIQGAYWAAPRGPESHVRDKVDHPVTCVSWHDANAFCAWATEMYRAAGQQIEIRLPTEAEW